MKPVVIHKFIYNDKDHPIFAFKQVSILQIFPGINVCLNFSNNGKIYCNNNDIKEEEMQFNDYLLEIQKHNAWVKGKTIFGIITGQEVVKQDFIKNNFVLYIYACFDNESKQWLTYEKVKSFITFFNYCDLIQLCPVLGVCENNYKEYKKFLVDSVYSILIFSYPQIFLTNDACLPILEYPNPIYQEDLIDYSLYPNFVFKEIQSIVDEVICSSFLRTKLAVFCNSKKQNLDDLKIENLSEFKKSILEGIDNIVPKDYYEKIKNHFKLFLQMCRINIRIKYIDFLIFGV